MPRARPVKRVFPEAAHQDLRWSVEAEAEAAWGFNRGDVGTARGVPVHRREPRTVTLRARAAPDCALEALRREDSAR